MDITSSENISKKRFVAILDILGFKERVKEKTHNAIYTELKVLKSFANEIENNLNYIDISSNQRKTRLSNIIFSDTIVFITNDTSDSDFMHLLIYTKIFIQLCIKNVIPIKGCIAVGDTVFDKTEQILFGSPIINAYLLAEEMKFMGIIFDKSVDKKILNFIGSESQILKGKVPLKSGNITHYYLNLKGESQTMSINSETGILKITNNDILIGINNMYFDANASPRIYFDNTLELFEKMP